MKATQKYLLTHNFVGLQSFENTVNLDICSEILPYRFFQNVAGIFPRFSDMSLLSRSVGSLRIEFDAPTKLQMATSECETDINDSELAGIIRQCVQEKINFQRSGRQGTSNLLHRTQYLTANATTSVPREFNNWRRNSLVSAVSPSICPSSCSTASTTNRSLAISNPHWPKRASTSTSRHLSHSWRLKKKRRWKILRSQSQVQL